MDDLLKKAREHRERALLKRAELDAVIQSLNEFIAAYEKVVATTTQDRSQPETGQADLFSGLTSRAERVRYVASMMEAAEESIVAADRPLTRSELLSELERRGFKIEGGDRSKVLGTNLWRSKKFYNIKGVGYWPKATPLPEDYQNYQLRSSMLTD